MRIELDVENDIHILELGDWVTPDLGAYQGDVGCIVAIHDWGYDVAFIPRYISSIADNYSQDSSLVVATCDKAHTLSGPGLAGAEPLLEDGLQILELSAKSVTIAGDIAVHILQMFTNPCAHVDMNKANSLQALVSRSLWKCPRPQEWVFSISEDVVVQGESRMTGRIIEILHAGLDVYCSYNGQVLSGENQGKLGCMQCIDDAVVLDILVWPANTKEINVWQNSVASTDSPKLFTALAPDKITDRMYTGKIPWQGVNVIVLLSNYPSVTTAHLYKGEVGTVLDVLLKQPGPKLVYPYGIAYLCLAIKPPSCHHEHIAAGRTNRKTSSVGRSTTPPHAGPSESLGTGNAWDPSAPEPTRTHWCWHPTLAQRELRIHMLGKTQPQKVQMELTGLECKMIHLFRTVAEEVFTPWITIEPVQPNVRDFHQWVVIQGTGLGKIVHDTLYLLLYNRTLVPALVKLEKTDLGYSTLCVVLVLQPLLNIAVRP
ncbi:hypothetical protein IW261DRAFT_1423563 [Armillaria novae-zelandiae]|uniref:Uncharacterized protein n=1 Tax=Armillaria novae-zelandiae TaxID=153914 RepID=A0AA39NXQ3_9AGAR|nr:hypothetical protein IW261DRAFT_1423563 [Armillaria novae-zelandiae]